jgi:hypothetical protein
MPTSAKLALAFAVVVSVAAPARAQPPGSFGPGRMTGGWTMLRNKSVQHEIRATPEQARRLDALFKEMQAKGRDEATKAREVAPEDRGARFLEFQRGQQGLLRKGLADILKPEQVKRFDQIDVQQAGVGAFAMPRVARALRLTDDQKGQLQKINQEMFSGMRGAGGDFQKDTRPPADKVAEARAWGLAKSIAVLTDDQKATWRDLTGEPFDLKVER